jgi:cytidine deaminase
VSEPPAPVDDELVAAARGARARAYAPFSGFAVGAALRLRDGRIVTGVNVENATYGLTMCAERVALFTAVAQGARPGDFAGVAVVGSAAGPTPPCGACRQLLWEFCGDVPVVCADDSGRHLTFALAALLPEPFDRALLG